jgi:hypothetical protein
VVAQRPLDGIALAAEASRAAARIVDIYPVVLRLCSGFRATIIRGRRERLPHLVTERCGFSYEAKLAKRLSTRRVRLARMILIQAVRNAVVNDRLGRNVADLAAIALGLLFQSTGTTDGGQT